MGKIMRHNMTLEQYLEELHRTLENFEEEAHFMYDYNEKKDIGEWDQIFLAFFSKSIEE